MVSPALACATAVRICCVVLTTIALEFIALDCTLLNVLELEFEFDELLALDKFPAFALDDILELEIALVELWLAELALDVLEEFPVDDVLPLETILELDVLKDEALDAMLAFETLRALLLDLLLPLPEEPPPHAVSDAIKAQENKTVKH